MNTLVIIYLAIGALYFIVASIAVIHYLEDGDDFEAFSKFGNGRLMLISFVLVLCMVFLGFIWPVSLAFDIFYDLKKHN